MDDTKKEVAHFNKTSESYLEEYGRETTEGYSFRVRREKVFELLGNDLQGKSVLDIGSGPGIMIAGLLERGAHVTALDAAEDMIALAKRQYGDNKDVSFVVGDARALQNTENSFDVVIAMGLVEYFEEDASFYEEMKRVLKPDGTLIVTYPNYWAPWRVWNRSFLFFLRPLRKLFGIDTSNKPSSIRHKEYAVTKVNEELAEHGFKTVETLYLNFKLIPYPFDVWLSSVTVATSTWLERLDSGPLRWIGTAFIVKAICKK